MKKRLLSTYFLLTGICCLLFFSACTGNPKLKLHGNVRNAEGKTLYFELFGMDKTEILDSVVLDKDGQFRFSTKLPSYPEFYRLRMGNRYIHLAADSSAKVSIEADGTNFGQTYQVEGSRCCELIRQLSQLQSKTLARVDALTAGYNNKTIGADSLQKQLQVILAAHRTEAKKVIFEDPRSPAAYFALFQRLHDYLIFDPYSVDDSKCYAAVATAWDTFYPNAIRSKNLKTLTLQGLKVIRDARDQTKGIQIKEQDKISFFEVALPNVYGKTVRLSSLKGKVVLIDFTAYQSEGSANRNLQMRELYRRYAAKGFEIYQVSLDTDEQFWKTGASNLPWICVRDSRSVQSPYLQTYNVQSIPTDFLMDRSSNIVARDVMVKDLGETINKLL